MVSRRIASYLSFVVFIGFAETLYAHPLDPPDLVYIDGVPCNILCQAYMAWSRKALAAARSTQHPPVDASRQAKGIGLARLQPSAHGRIAKRSTAPVHVVHRDPSIASPRVATAPRRTQTDAAKVERTGSSSTNHTETPGDRQAEQLDTSQPNSPTVSQAKLSDTKQADTSDTRKAEAPDTSQAPVSNALQAKPPRKELAKAPSDQQTEPSSTKHTEAPASLPSIESTAASGKSSVREQIIAAATMAEQLTAASDAATKRSATESDEARRSGDTGDITAATSPSTADALVAVLVSRPEINSMSDLTGKNVAIDNNRPEPENNVRTALVAAGAPAVELTASEGKAIDRLIDGAVPAAVVALVSPSAADAFPDVEGFKVYRIPLSPPSVKGGMDKP